VKSPGDQTGIEFPEGCLSPEDLVNLSTNPISSSGSCCVATTIFSLSPDDDLPRLSLFCYIWVFLPSTKRIFRDARPGSSVSV